MNAASPVLLALDDDAQIVETICAIASKAGFHAIASTSPGQLQELLQSARPDVVVLDLQMPGTDGVSALRYLADIGTKAKIFLVTGMDERTIASAEQYGLRRGLEVMGALQKPFDPGDFLSRLEQAHAAIRPLTPADLQQAIDRHELVVHYQPIVRRFADNTWDICAVEALLRWNHPVRGLLTPDSFMALGEAHGLSRAMTDFVLQSGIEQLKGWLAAGLRVGLRVNIAATLIADIAFPDRLEALLLEHALDPHSLTLEVTETGVLEQTPETYDIFTRLRIKNISLALDDFGTGYSSLTELFRMPFNELKIDKSLVGKIVESKEAAIIVDALVSLAHKLGLTACAEGVEDAATLEALGRIGCDYAQGYYISQAVAPAQIPTIIKRWDLEQRRLARVVTS